MAVQTNRGIPLSAVCPRFLHSNSTSHTWAFGAIAELIDNAYDPDVKARQFWIDKTVIKNQDCLIFMDNGAGMDYDKMHKMLSFGFSDKQTINGHIPIGLFGNGFKSGSMRLGKDAIVFSKKADCMCVGLLSQTYLEQTKATNVIVPVVMFKTTGKTISSVPEHKPSLEDILTHSLFNTKEELSSEFSAINGPYGKNSSGTRIIIWNLRKTLSGSLEFDFSKDRYDIQIPVDQSENIKEQNKRLEGGISVPDSRYSLRAYTSILYLKPKMQIIIRGQKVKTQLISKSLANIIKDTYKPTFLNQKKGISITFGYNTKSKEHYGIMLYHKNRLIRPYERVACQSRNNSTGVGVIGVIECNFLKPTHNKQQFDNTEEYRKTMQSLSIKLEEYWKEVRFRQRITNCPEPAKKRPDQNWVQCDECLQWRKLPDGIDNDLLPEKWFCRMNPDPQFRSCQVQEEPEDSDDEEHRLEKTYKKHEKLQKLQEERNKKQQEFEQKKAEEQKLAKLARENAALHRKLVHQLRDDAASKTTSPTISNLLNNSNEADDSPKIIHVTSLHPSISRNKRVAGPEEDVEPKRCRKSVSFDLPVSQSTSMDMPESFSILQQDDDDNNKKDDEDIMIIESASTPRRKHDNSTFDLSKVKTEISKDNPKMSMECNGNTDQVSMATQTGLNSTVKLETANKEMTLNSEKDNRPAAEASAQPPVEMRENNQQEPPDNESSTENRNELKDNCSTTNQTKEPSTKMSQLINNQCSDDPHVVMLPEMEVGHQSPLKLNDSNLNAQEAQEQQDNLLDLLQATAKELDDNRAQQHQLILQVEDLQSQLLELKRSSVKREQSDQNTQTSFEETLNYKEEYIKAKQKMLSLENELSQQKIKLQESLRNKEASAVPNSEQAGQTNLKRDKELEELKEKVKSLENENSSLSTCAETLQKDLEETVKASQNRKVKVEDHGVQTDVSNLSKDEGNSAGASNSGRALQPETPKKEPQEREELNTQTCSSKLRDLRKKVSHLLVSFVPALELNQVNYDCEVIDEILDQVINELSSTESNS